MSQTLSLRGPAPQVVAGAMKMHRQQTIVFVTWACKTAPVQAKVFYSADKEREDEQRAIADLTILQKRSSRFWQDTRRRHEI